MGMPEKVEQAGTRENGVKHRQRESVNKWGNGAERLNGIEN